MVNGKLGRALVSLIMAAVMPFGAYARQPGSEVLEGINLQERAGCAWIDIHFQIPVGYLSHFPAGEGRRLRIDVQLLGQTEMLADGVREVLRLRAAGPLNLTWVDFESTAFGRGVLYVEFNESTLFKVGQGSDGRSVVIAVPAKDGVMACDVESLQKRQ